MDPLNEASEILRHNSAIVEGHNPDSQCFECCKKIEELHSTLLPLLKKIDQKVEEFDMSKLEKIMSSPFLKPFLKG